MSSSGRLGHFNRRTFARGGVLFTAAALGLRTGLPGEAQASQGAPSPYAAAAPPRYVSIVAHPDDDLIFINPEIQQPIAMGAASRTIVITASEAVPEHMQDELSREQYADDQMTASRGAYALFAGKPDAWTRTRAVVAGKAVEVASLDANPNVQLVFLGLPDSQDFQLPEDQWNALQRLWENRDNSLRIGTFVVPGSPVDEAQTYTRDELVAVLAELLEDFTPTTIRLQDPFPDPRYWHEHEDHVHGARFAQLAANSYIGPSAGRFAVVPRYRCYNTGGNPNAEAFPANVPTRIDAGTVSGPLATKWAGYQIFKDHDPITTDTFDPQVDRNYQRWPVAAPWVVRDGTGQLHAFAAVANHVVAWRNTGSTWTGPTVVAGSQGTFAPGVAVAVDGDGRVVLAVLDLDEHVIFVNRQVANGGGFGGWVDLGNPDGGEFSSSPCLVRNADGGMELLVRNADGRLSNKAQPAPGAAWDGQWYAIGSSHAKADETQDTPVGFLSANGRIDVFSQGFQGMLHWSQPAGGSFAFDGAFADKVIENTGGPALAAFGNGRLAAFVRENGDGAIGVLVADTSGNWPSVLTHLGGTEGGIGAPAAVTASDGKIIVGKRNNDRTVSALVASSPTSFGGWANLGGDVEVGPAAVLDKNGFVRLLAIFGDGQLYERKQSATGGNGAFGAWAAVGS